MQAIFILRFVSGSPASNVGQVCTERRTEREKEGKRGGVRERKKKRERQRGTGRRWEELEEGERKNER